MRNVMLALFAFGLGIGVGSAMLPAHAEAAAPQDVITARTINVVDESGKVVITLTSQGETHGIWVNGRKPGCTAGIVGGKTTDTPYVMVLDATSGKGCQWSVYSEGGEPQVQYSGRDRIRIFNPLDK